MSNAVKDDDFEPRAVVAHSVEPIIMPDAPPGDDIAIGLRFIHEGVDGDSRRTTMLCKPEAAVLIANAIMELLALRNDTSVAVPAICLAALAAMKCDPKLLDEIDAFRVKRNAELEATENARPAPYRN